MTEQSLLDFFREVWLDGEREHKSVVSGEPLFFNINCFAHVLSRGAWVSYKFDPRNIVLMTPAEHKTYDHATHIARADSRFDHVFELADKLRAEYHDPDRVL